MRLIITCAHSSLISNSACMLYPPSERSATVQLADMLFSLHVCLCVSVCVHSYLDASISQTVWDRDLVPITH